MFTREELIGAILEAQKISHQRLDKIRHQPQNANLPPLIQVEHDWKRTKFALIRAKKKAASILSRGK